MPKFDHFLKSDNFPNFTVSETLLKSHSNTIRQLFFIQDLSPSLRIWKILDSFNLIGNGLVFREVGIQNKF